MSNRIFDTVTENYNSAVAEELPVYECYDAETGDMLALAESAQDMIGVYEAMHAYGMLELQEEKNPGTITMESFKEKAGNVFTRIREGLQKLWAKIRSFFDNVIVSIKAKVQGGKAFASKYGEALKKKDLTGFKVEIYPYTGLDGDPCSSLYANAEKCVNSVNKEEKRDKATFSAKKEEYIEKIRGTVAGKSRLDKSEFNDAIVEKFRGATSKSETTVDITKILEVLKDEKTLKTAIKTKSEMDKAFANKIKTINQRETDSKKQVKEAKDESKEAMNGDIIEASNDSVLFTEAQHICTSYFQVWKSVSNERESAYKSICAKAFKYKAK